MIRHLLTSLTAVLLLLLPVRALAMPECPADEHRAELTAFQDELLGAADVDEARELALEEVERTRKAVDRAARIVPGDSELAAHQDHIRAMTTDIQTASTRAEVAESFASLQAHQGSSCYYSTGEIIAIVLGFILGIIPGVVLLFLLC